MPPRRAGAAVAALVLFATAGPAAAATQVARDGAGRSITFDVQAAGADVAGYTSILDGLLHGDEISRVIVTIVPEASIPGDCAGDSSAVACYRWSSRGGATIFVPAVPPERVRPALAHEYGHHVDATRPHVANAPGLDGTPQWWRARDMTARLARGEVAWDYSLGWDRSIAEIFAEDYAVTNGAGHSGIRWLGDPGPAVQDAIRTDLSAVVLPPTPTPPASATLPPPSAGESSRAAAAAGAVRRGGRLAGGRTVRIPVLVRAPGTLRARVGGATAGRLRAVLRCGGAAVSGAIARPGRPATVRAHVAPGRCVVAVRALGATSRYTVVARAS